MSCNNCPSERIIHIEGELKRLKGNYSAPINRGVDILTCIGIGGRNIIRIDICLDCGMIQSRFPVRLPTDSEIVTFAHILPELGGKKS